MSFHIPAAECLSTGVTRRWAIGANHNVVWHVCSLERVVAHCTVDWPTSTLFLMSLDGPFRNHRSAVLAPHVIQTAVRFVLLEQLEAHRLGANFTTDRSPGTIIAFVLHKLMHFKCAITMLALPGLEKDVLDNDIYHQEYADKDIEDTSCDERLLHALLGQPIWRRRAREVLGLPKFTNIKSKRAHCHNSGCGIQETEDVRYCFGPEGQEVEQNGYNAKSNSRISQPGVEGLPPRVFKWESRGVLLGFVRAPSRAH